MVGLFGYGRAHEGPEASFSQGDRWTMLISTYIAVMSSIGGTLEPDG
jgi:hypothetical protein